MEKGAKIKGKMIPQNKRTTCVICFKQHKHLIKNKFCSKECQETRAAKCEKCGKINDSDDSIFCNRCKQERVVMNKKIMGDKATASEVAKKFGVHLPRSVL